MDRLQAMRMFTRVIDEGSFAAAARSINVSPAVVTRLIAELEEHLGARLINRTTRRLALTEAGEAYLERVRHILIELEDAEALASASTVEARGTLRVLCPPAFAVHQLAKHLPAFRARHPKVTVELTAPGAVETVDDNFDGQAALFGQACVADPDLCTSPAHLKRAVEAELRTRFVPPNVLPSYVVGHPHGK